MSEQKQSNSFISIGFTGALTLLFIALKLCSVINWSWWWVTCPSWIPIALMMLGTAIYILAKLPEYIQKKIAEARIRKIMALTGKSYLGAKVEYYLIPRGKWREWVEEQSVKVKEAEEAWNSINP